MVDEVFSIDGLDGYQFEELIAKIMKKKGYENITVTKKSGDEGKDIIMDSPDGDLVIVECKHTKFVGRPIIQKLQGAMSHEQVKHPEKDVKGIVVTSGAFSKEAIQYNKEIGQDIELIDGKKLKSLCKTLNIVVLNGKVQILTDNCFKHIDNDEAINSTIRGYKKIYGHENHEPMIKTDIKFKPVCSVQFNVGFSTHTSIGCVDDYSDSGTYILDGVTGHSLSQELVDFFFGTEYITMGKLEQKDSKKKISYEFTENDVEDFIINEVIKEHTHTTTYTGNNNVTYSKKCVPKRRDIDIIKFLPIYLPYRSNKLDVLKMDYKQDFYNKGSSILYSKDELRKCKICERELSEYEDMSMCIECARIVCKNHIKIDYWDKKTPICTIHAKILKLWLQKKYFAFTKNKKEYEKWYNECNFFEKFYEDKIVFGLSIAGIILIVILIIMWLNGMF